MRIEGADDDEGEEGEFWGLEGAEASISETASSRASLRMSAREREAPRAKSVLAVAREMPEAAPVTAMILPAREAIAVCVVESRRLEE